MLGRMKCILVVLLGAALVEGKRPALKDLSRVDSLRNTALKKLDTLWRDSQKPEWEYIARRMGGEDALLMSEMKKICDGITVPGFNRLDTDNLQIFWWSVIEDDSDVIQGFFANFRRLQEKIDPLLYSKAWGDFAHAVHAGSTTTSSIPITLLRIQDMVYNHKDPYRESIYHLALKEAGTSLCNIQQSPQLLIFNLYTTIQLTQLKAYSMIQFSWMLLKFYGKGNFTLETKMMRETYLKRLSDQAVAVKDVMRKASREMWRCDPRKHQEGETYTELTKLLQGYIVNEVDLVEEPSCRENCGYFQFTKQYNCYKNNYCSKQPTCRGDIVGCKYVDSDMWICPGESSSKRRYDWIEYENGRKLGLQKSCNRAVTKVDSWWTWLVYHCSYCFCFCDDHTSTLSDRFFNLREVTSDVEKNNVITGIKFVKVKRVIYLQIQQGQMMPKAQINESTVNWKKVDSYDVKSSGYKEDRDYHKLTYSKRALDLDNLFAPKGYVVTGVKFRTVGSHLNFEMRVSQFNFTSGQLISKGGKSHWISNDNTDLSPHKPRRKLELEKPDVPTRNDIPSKPDSESDMYLEFTHSDVDMDVGQSTVPFIDVQEVVPSPPVPLSGIGIYHKGKMSFGGFVAPKVFTFDYVDSIQDNYLDIKPL